MDEENIIKIDWKWRAKVKITKIKASIRETVNGVTTFVKEHPTEAATIFVAGTSMIKKCVKDFNHAQSIRNSRYLADRTIYDNRNQIRLDLRRKLNNREKIEYARRMDMGESAYDILKSMRAL